MPFDSANVESEVTTVLRQALAYLRDPKHWAQFVSRRRDRVCAIGAINMYADYQRQRTVNNEAVRMLAKQLPGPGDERFPFSFSEAPRARVQGFNDGSVHHEVVALFEKALAISIKRDLAGG